MTGFKPKLDVDLDDRTGAPRAVYFHIREDAVVETKELLSGVAYADYNATGLLVGIELLAEGTVQALDDITKYEDPVVQRFVKSATPRGFVKEMAVA